MRAEFYILLTVHPGMILVNNQPTHYAGAYAPAYQTVIYTE